MERKTCTKCGETRALDKFYRMKASKDGYQRHCKSCHREYQREYRANMPIIKKERYLAKQREHQRKHRANRTPEQKVRESERQKEWYASLSPEEKQFRAERRRERILQKTIKEWRRKYKGG